uniref:Uncharacterized protein n=1 Tax=Panagrolaimus sp. JU765 TaxID=591449 RepID=A0AC34PXR1_9BILA
MSDQTSKKSAFKILDASNHVSFAVKMEQALENIQDRSIERILSNKSQVYIEEEIRRSRILLRKSQKDNEADEAIRKFQMEREEFRRNQEKLRAEREMMRVERESLRSEKLRLETALLRRQLDSQDSR